MKIALASDHGGYELKEKVKDYLTTNGYNIVDLGTYSEESVDYPKFGKKCADCVVGGAANRGIVFCGTGIGISIAANKVKGARCALVTSEFTAKMAAEHNQANLLAFGGRTTEFDQAIQYIEIWLSTPADTAERHVRRVEMLNEM
jgi:ribose 5-phosphate isomerase B